MTRALARLLALTAAAVLVACPPPEPDDDDTTVEDCDNDGPPEILINPIEDGQPVGFPVQVVVQVTDGDGVNTVSLYYRTEGQPGFAFGFMSNEGTGDETIYVADIPADVVQDPGVDYYVRATDRATGCQEEAFLPATAPDEPANFQTLLELQPLPYYEFFETDVGCADVGTEMDELNWTAAIRSFPQAIHGWRLTDRNPLSGECAAFHSEGIPGGFWECPPPDGEGTIERDNWLISEPLDFSGKEEIAVRWFERWQAGGPCAEVHSLYVSVGSPNPDAGEYEVVVADLPFPGSAWESSEWYDLSAYAGAEQVYIALQYLGGAAGRWQVDDFYVGEPLADLQLAAAALLDDDAGPGSTEVPIEVSVVNVSDLYGAPALTATLTTADPDLTITASGNTFDEVAPGATVEANSVFLFDVGAAHPDHAYLDFAMTLDDGEGHTWTVPIRLLMGEDSEVEVTYTAPAGAALEFELGHGPQASPDFATTASSDDLAGDPWTFVATEQAHVLPPAPGTFRWHLTVANSGSVAGTVDGVVFTVGGEDHVVDYVPLTVEPGEEAVLLIPPPPVLSVVSYDLDPDPAAPGAAQAISALTLENTSRETAGPVACVMGSSSGDVSGFDSSPTTFGADPIPTDGTATADADFTFDIDAGHIDNTAIPLTLLCNDGADTLTHTFDLEVPYAHPVVDSIRIDDDEGGDDNGLLDPDEDATVYLTALNDGAFATDGPLTAHVALGDGSTADGISLVPVDLDFGEDPLDPEATVESTNGVLIELGPDNALGDNIVLDVTWTAGDDEWTEELIVEVTGLPWIDCPEAPDPEGDLALPYDFDISGCAYRSDGVMLQVRADSYIPYDPAVVFVDFVFYEVPQQYTIESVGGVPDFELGCVLQNDPAPFTTPIDILFEGNSVIARLAIEDIGALGNNTQVAIGAGSCPDVFFCDTYPPGALNFNVAEGTYNCDGNDFIPLNW